MKLRVPSLARLAAVAALLTALTGCCCLRERAPRPGPGQAVFASPEVAAQALVQAVRQGDTNALVSVFGENGREIVLTGDPVEDAAVRKTVAAQMDEQVALTNAGGRIYLLIGKDAWRLAVPVVSRGADWFFDTEEGKEELLTRRIGRNELSAIKVCRAVVHAQQEFASVDRDGDSILEYAGRLVSEPGKTNGLFWVSGDGRPQGPIGPLLAEAEASGYTVGTPYHGYRFKLLHAQGPAAPGGQQNYFAGEDLTGGFALLAYPDDYGVSGIMSFVAGDMGIIYEKNLGRRTAEKARAMTEFNPDATWAPVMEE